MKDYEVYELQTAEEIDEAFADIFRFYLPDGCNWAQMKAFHAVRTFLESLTGEQRVRSWSITLRNWSRKNGNDFKAEVSNKRQRGGVWYGLSGYGFDNNMTLALMKAAIQWDQNRRWKKRQKVQQKREAARKHHLAPMPMNH